MKSLFKKTCALLVVISLSSGSCADLNEIPYSKLSSSTTFTTASSVEGAKLGVYSKLTGEAGFGITWNIWAPQTVSADEIVIPVREGIHWDDAGRPRQCHQHTFDPEAIDWRYGEAFNVLMQAVAAANDFLANTKDLNESVAPNASKAEVRFLRAFAYWQLIDMYGSVPYVTEPLGPGQLPEQTDRATIYDNLITELDEIIGILPEIAVGRKDAGKVTKQAAQTLKVKLMLNQKVYKGTDPDYASIETLCTSIIGASGLSLEANYFDNFDDDNSGSKEAIWAVVGEVGKTKELIRAPINAQLHYSGATTYDHPSFWNGPAALPTFVDRFDTSNTVDYTSLQDNRRVVGTDTLFYNTPMATNFRDHRVAMFVRGQQFVRVGRAARLEGNTEVYKNEDVVNVIYTKAIGYRTKEDNTRKEQGGYGTVLVDENEFDGFGTGPFTGYRVFKFVPKPGLTQATVNNDYPVFRLGDVYLMRAEARVMQNKGAEAAADVNTIRRRAAGGVDVDFTAANGKSYSTTAATVTLDDIKDERSRELVNEGHRRTDLIRWGDFEQNTDPNLAGYSQFRTAAFRSKHGVSITDPATRNLYPIPTVHLGANPNLKQNPGY